MEYTIKNDNILLKDRFRTKTIAARRITSVRITDKKASFLGNGGTIYEYRVCKEAYDLADALFAEYECEQVEYAEPALLTWRKISDDLFVQETNDKVKMLNQELDRLREQISFDLYSEVFLNEQKRYSSLRVWGEKDGERLRLNRRFQEKGPELSFDVEVIAPYILNRDKEKIVLAVNDDCVQYLKDIFALTLRYVKG